MSEWQPIETAPKGSYRRFDVWVSHSAGRSRREADACRDNTGRIIDRGGNYLDWEKFDDDIGSVTITSEVTHWMPPPAPPSKRAPPSDHENTADSK